MNTYRVSGKSLDEDGIATTWSMDVKVEPADGSAYAEVLATDTLQQDRHTEIRILSVELAD